MIDHEGLMGIPVDWMIYRLPVQFMLGKTYRLGRAATGMMVLILAAATRPLRESSGISFIISSQGEDIFFLT